MTTLTLVGKVNSVIHSPMENTGSNADLHYRVMLDLFLKRYGEPMLNTLTDLLRRVSSPYGKGSSRRIDRLARLMLLSALSDRQDDAPILFRTRLGMMNAFWTELDGARHYAGNEARDGR